MAERASGNDSPARTPEVRLSTTSGHSSRRSACRLCRSLDTTSRGTAAANRAKMAETLMDSVSATHRTPTSSADRICSAISWPG